MGRRMGAMDGDRTGRPGPNERGVTVAEAAEALGISPEAVRMRIKRGTLRSEKHAGRVYVLLGRRPTNEQTAEQTPDHTAELIATLQEQLAAERQAHAEARRIIAGLVERIPAIEAPSEAEASEDDETNDEQEDRGQPRSGAPGAQESAPRPWWRRVFGS